MIVLTTNPSPGVIRWGETAAPPCVHIGAPNGAGKTFQLQASHDQTAWFAIATLTTNATGDATFPYRPSDNRYYRVSFAGTADLAAAVSATVRIVVRQLNLLRPTNLGAVRVVAAGTAITFTSTVRPARPELPQAHVNFVVYRLVSGQWTLASEPDPRRGFIGPRQPWRLRRGATPGGARGGGRGAGRPEPSLPLPAPFGFSPSSQPIKTFFAGVLPNFAGPHLPVEPGGGALLGCP